ncbi:MAG: peptidase S15 [Nocardioides sp.]|nr:peptidase S15 [Nocardioides sp.]
MTLRTTRTTTRTRGAGLLGATALAVGLLAPATAAPATAAPLTQVGPVAVQGAAPGAARAARAADGVTVRNACVRSVPEPGSTAKVRICFTLFKPAKASRSHKVPVIMHSHGWGGSRTTDPAEFADLTSRGYGVLSFDQRGWGESGGHAHVENPAYEGVDVRTLVRFIARQPWVRKDGPGDPRLGAIGGSYGGGYQFVGAFELLKRRGKPVFDALAPEITWNDLSESLAPEGVVRTEWALALSAASVPDDALPRNVYKALIEGAATGTWPDGSIPGTEDMVSFMRKNGPQWHTRAGRRLDIPVLFGQGTTDSLFPLQQGLDNWRTAITNRARKKSIFIGYNGGHVLPSVLPQGVSVTSDPCSRALGSRDFRALSVRFFDEQLRGHDRGVRGYHKVHLATADSTCVTQTSGGTRAGTAVPIGTVASTTAAGAPLPYLVADGPVTVAGTPYLTGAVTALGVQNRAFYGLAVGSSPLDAHLVQNNVLPLAEDTPVSGAQRRVELPSAAVRVPRGQHLYLMVTPISDTFAGMSSRTPGVITIDDTVVHLPVVRR